ncbi:MAG: family membership [Bacteroidia bacterium]
MRKVLKISLKIFLFGLSGALVLICVCLGLFWVEHSQSVTLPVPTGTYAVGRTTFAWKDSTRTDSLAPTPDVKRELVVWVWYPADSANSDIVADYFPADLRKALKERQGPVLSNIILKDLSKVHSHSILNARLSSKQVSYPVLLMKSGIGAMAGDYTTLAEELASHGYVVVGSDAPYSTSVVVFPDGRVVFGTQQGNPGDSAPSEERTRRLNRLVTIWTADTRFVLDKLESLNKGDVNNIFSGHLNLQELGVFGHSFGGATALQFCRDDIRCKVSVDMDGAPFGAVSTTGLPKPVMFLLADHAEESDSASLEIQSNIQSIYDRLPESRIWISLRGARHFNFSDRAILTEWFVSRIFGALGPIGEERGLTVSSACLRIFFDVYLKARPVTAISRLPEQYPEVRFERSLPLSPPLPADAGQ